VGRTIRVVAVVCFWLVSVLPGVASPQETEPFESLLASAQQAQAGGDFESAAEFYRKAVAVHPEIPELEANLGLMYYQVGKNQQAIGAFNQAIRLKPGLFVPNLFLGLDYVRLKRFNEAIPYLKRAVLLSPTDIQARLALGHAYTGIGKTRQATESYSRVVQIDQKNADGWFYLGVSYLEQVEADSRILLARHKDSGYFETLVADTFAEQGAFIQAADAYKKALTFPAFPAGTHAAYGFLLLSRHDLPGAQRELNAELASNPGSLMAKLGMARLHVEQGAVPEGVKEIGEVWRADANFLRANAALFNAGLPRPKRADLQRVLEEQQATDNVSQEVLDLFRNRAATKRLANMSQEPSGDVVSLVSGGKGPAGNAAELYARGRYRECTNLLASRLPLLPTKDLQRLAFCAYSSANFQPAAMAAQKLAVNAATAGEGLYWETRSVQKLATNALARASQLDSNSPKFHVLLGDVYRQRKYFPDAKQEYRKALALNAEDTGALFGLSLTLLAKPDLDEALRITQSALTKHPDDPEFNAVMGEILSIQHNFAGAEPYLKKGLSTKPELVPHVHALLGRVYAETNRTQEAIAESRLGLADDKDGRLHYQIARLYLKVGDHDSAKQAFAESDRLRRESLSRAAVAMQQGENNRDSQ
jgi:tetratricopeptide (TPR) repeat protein